MKTKLFATTVLMLVLMSSAFAGSEAILVSASSAVTSTLLYYEPVPAQPGDQVDIWIQIDNDGGAPSKPATVTIIDSAYIKAETESDRTNQIPSIPSQESFLLQLKVRIAKEAHEGEHPIQVDVQQEGSNGVFQSSLTIDVKGTTSALSIVSAQTIPEHILPGETARMQVVVENVGATLVRNVDISLDFDDLSIAPIGSSNSKTINSLAGGEKYTFSFDIVSFPDAEAKANQLPITLMYDDEQGNEKIQEEEIGIIVGTKPELLVYFENVDLTTDNPKGSVVIKFVNKGLAEIKLLEIDVLESDDIDVLSESNIIYVGNIDEDDYESAEVMLEVTGEDVSLPLKVLYRDALNRQYEEDLSLPLRLQGDENGGNAGSIFWVFVLVVLAVGVWYWMRRRKSRRK